MVINVGPAYSYPQPFCSAVDCSTSAETAQDCSLGDDNKVELHVLPLRSLMMYPYWDYMKV